jgi:hypothetical protein
VKRVLAFTLLAGAWQVGLLAQRGIPPGEAAPYQRAIYPDGPPRRVNPLSEKTEQTEFALNARATLPGSTREVVVYSDRITKDLPFDKMYWVYVALLDRTGNTLRVLDRVEVTEDLKLFTEVPGNFLALRALVSPFAARSTTVAAVELETALEGTGGVREASHFFYTVFPEAKLARVLMLDATYAGGRSGADAGAKFTTFRVGVAADVSGDLALATRNATWNAFDNPPKPICGIVAATYYRFTGSGYQQATPRTITAASFRELPTIPVQVACN